MGIEVVTKEDLQVFRIQLLIDLKEIFTKQQSSPTDKKWLKSAEVMELMSLSAGKLQNLRITGKLPFTKIGSILYYRYEDVSKLFEAKTD